jgi:hypothetical protein
MKRVLTIHKLKKDSSRPLLAQSCPVMVLQDC